MALSLKDLAEKVKQSFSGMASGIPFTPQFNQQAQRLSSYIGPQSKFGQLAQPVSPQAQLKFGVDYLKGQVAQPIYQGVKTAIQPGVTGLQRGLGAVQAIGGVFSATPIGMVSNLITGASAGIARSARTGQPLAQSVYKGTTTPTSFATAGLNIKNPYLALGVDVLTSGGNPMALRPLKTGLVSKLRMSTNTLDDLDLAESILKNPDAYIDQVAYKDPVSRERALREAIKASREIVERTAAKFLPDKAMVRAKGDPLKMIKELSILHSQNRLENIPGMSLVGESIQPKGVGEGGKYYRTISQGGWDKPPLKEVVENAKKVEINSQLDTYVYRHKNGEWFVNEASTGLSLGRGAKTGKGAIAAAIEAVNKIGVKRVREIVARRLPELHTKSLGEFARSDISLPAPPTQPRGVNSRVPLSNLLPDQSGTGISQAGKPQSPIEPLEVGVKNQVSASSPKTLPHSITDPIKDFEENVLGDGKKYTRNIDPPIMKSDVASVRAGTAMSELGADTPKQAFADWVNARRATTIEGALQGEEFRNLDSKGIWGVFEFQTGKKTGEFAKVKNYFDSKYGLLQEQGIEFNYKDDYLPQIWLNSTEEVNKVFRTLTRNPGFSVESLIKNYREGIEAGLTPRFTKISDLVSSYEKATNKAVADHNFFKYLADEGMILSPRKAPRDWITLNPDRFPKFSFETDTGQYTGAYKAPPEIASMINNYLGDANFKQLESLANFVSASKNRLLSFGIPYTGINAHGFNIMARNTLAEKNPVIGLLKSGYYMLNPAAADKFVKTNLAKAPEAIKNGLTFSTSEYQSLLEAPKQIGIGASWIKGLKNMVGEKWNSAFEKPLFDKMIPALKLNYYEQLIKSGIDGKEAAKVVNNVFGGFNWEQLGKSRDWQNVKRAIILAPDWLSSNLRIGGNIVKSFLPGQPAGKAYRRFAANFLATFVMANIANKLISGKWMYENDPGNTFNLDTGTFTADGKKRYIRLFGTAADFVRIPIDVTLGLAKGNPTVVFRTIRNRLSTVVGPALALAFNTDYLGNPIYGKDKFGRELTPIQSAAGIAGELSTIAGVPAFTKQILDYATGKQGAEQSVTQAFELPIRYSGGSYTSAQKQIKDITGVTGKDLYEQNNALRGQAKFGDKQIEALKTGSVNINDIISARATSKRESEVKDKISLEQGGVTAVGDKYYYWNPESQTVKSISLTFSTPMPKTTGIAEVDRANISDYKGKISARVKEIGKLLDMGVINQQQAMDQIDKLNKLKASISTAKKPKKFTVPKVTIKPLRLKSTTTKKYRMAKAPTFKLSTKTPTLSVGKLPSYKNRGVKISLTKNFKSSKMG